jgi:DNA-binding NarL/FixJ family response regulator
MNGTTATFGMPLTSREKEILTYIAEGLSSKQIAGKLLISEYTVANHRKNMLSKMGARNSAELVRINING